MKSVIKQIYLDLMNENLTETESVKKAREDEYSIYNSFFPTLSDEQKDLFLELESAITHRHCKEQEYAYQHGVKTGAIFILEIMEITP